MINLNKIRFGGLGFILVILCIDVVLHGYSLIADRPGPFWTQAGEPIGLATFSPSLLPVKQVGDWI